MVISSSLTPHAAQFMPLGGFIYPVVDCRGYNYIQDQQNASCESRPGHLLAITPSLVCLDSARAGVAFMLSYSYKLDFSSCGYI